MRLAALFLSALAGLSACGPAQLPSVAVVESRCAAQARAAAGPTGGITVGTSTSDGPFTNIAIGVTDDFLRGRDPAAVYAECYQRYLGAPPQTPYNPVAR